MPMKRGTYDKKYEKALNITMLDHIAIAAMQGYIAYNGFISYPEDISKRAYIMAEAMIAESLKREKST